MTQDIHVALASLSTGQAWIKWTLAVLVSVLLAGVGVAWSTRTIVQEVQVEAIRRGADNAVTHAGLRDDVDHNTQDIARLKNVPRDSNGLRPGKE